MTKIGSCFWWRHWLLFLWGAGLFASNSLHAAIPAEEQAFSSAQALFDDHQYNRAEAKLTNYLATFATNSPNRAYAILYLARARLELSNYNGGIQLLTSGLPTAGALAGEYVFWTATAHFNKGEYAVAADGFASFIKTFTNSPRLMEAACDEAEAYSKMENWPRVVELLQKPGGTFRRLAAANEKNSIVIRGWLLLGEALLAENHYGEGEKLVNGIDASGLGPEWQWRRVYLLCRLELAGGKTEDALQNSTNLMAIESGPRHQAAARFLLGEILEKLDRIPAALQSYTNNLNADLPPEIQRQALLKTVQLTSAHNQIQEAVQLLENYVAARTNGAALDLARISLGELYLKIYYAPAPSNKASDTSAVATNFLQQAQLNFDTVISNFSSSPLAPQARLDRGWGYWAQTNMAAAETDFQAATDQLNPSPEQAVARFKLADAQFYQGHYGPALSNYNLLLKQYAGVESVTNDLFDQALYQIVEASVKQNDPAGAQAALEKILGWYPNSLFGDRGQLLIGESRRYDYNMARQYFNDLLKRSPQTPLRAEVEYAVARTYEQQGNWGEAIRQYDLWVKQHATNAPALLPQVEYARALVYGKAGQESNALVFFTNFVARYSTNSSLAPWAQNWVADYYFNQGDNQSAEGNYQLIYEKFPNAGDLPYQARLMAGRAALARQGTTDARQDFTDLVGNTNAPANLVEQGYFALGDTILQQFLSAPTNPIYLNDAITAFSKLTNGAPTNAMAALAFGRLGDCYMRWGDLQWEIKRDPKIYDSAVQMYQAVTNFPESIVDVTTLSEAEVALGRIAETQNQPEAALAHYCKVLYEMDPDHFDPFWIGQAGRAAGRLYEQQKQEDKAIKVYQRVQKAVPSLRAPLEKAIINAQSDLDKARN